MLRHQHLIKYLFNRELSEMYISVGLKNLALSMAGIFVPLYLFIDLQYPLTKVVFFFIVYSITMIIFAPFAAKFLSKYGVKHGILLSMFGFVAYILLLTTLPYHSFYILPAIIWGAANSFYWISFHTDFTKFSDRKNRGQEVSIWFITAFLGILLGPILGSVIITYLGFITLFIIVSLLLLLSAVPLFMSSEVHPKTKFSLKHVFKNVKLKDTYIYIILGLRTIISQVALPIFIFLILNTYLSIGVVASFAALGSVITGWFVGRLSKNVKRERTMFRYGSLFQSLGWFGFIFVKTIIQIIALNIYLSITYIFVDIPHHTLFYSRANKSKNPVEFIVYRDIMIDVGRILGLVVILITGKLIVTLVIGGIGSLSLLFL